MNERKYNNLMNEGGEGYNPHSKEEARPMDRAERMDRLMRIMAGTSTHDPRYAELRAEYNALYEEVWSLATTKARREAWNTKVVDAKKAGKKINLPRLEKEMGFAFAELKKAIAHHNL